MGTTRAQVDGRRAPRERRCSQPTEGVAAGLGWARCDCRARAVSCELAGRACPDSTDPDRAGVVALRALRVSSAAVVRYPLYIPAAALAVVMAGGLAADLLGPVLGDAHPLSNQTAAFSVLLLSFLLSLAGAAGPTTARFPWRAAIRRPELLLPLALPLLAVAAR